MHHYSQDTSKSFIVLEAFPVLNGYLKTLGLSVKCGHAVSGRPSAQTLSKEFLEQARIETR